MYIHMYIHMCICKFYFARLNSDWASQGRRQFARDKNLAANRLKCAINVNFINKNINTRIQHTECYIYLQIYTHTYGAYEQLGSWRMSGAHNWSAVNLRYNRRRLAVSGWRLVNLSITVAEADVVACNKTSAPPLLNSVQRTSQTGHGLHVFGRFTLLRFGASNMSAEFKRD